MEKKNKRQKQKGVICDVRAYIWLPFLSVAQQESGTIKAIF
jgi:hypothetical protein